METWRHDRSITSMAIQPACELPALLSTRLPQFMDVTGGHEQPTDAS
jgi:hypothetical protein